MRGKIEEDNVDHGTFLKSTFLFPKVYSMRMWLIATVWLAGVQPPCCLGVQVFVKDERRVTVLFQSVVLPCHYTTVSTQTPVVQWVFKSYCHDRTRDSFGFADGAGGSLGGGAGLRRGYESRAMPAYLDCSDNSRTVRNVASISGSSVTLSEYYKNRDISIINKADLRIGEVKWGDSGLYFCKVVISDDLEGKNEAPVELLVLGLSGEPEDLLPGFDLKIMPEWVFVAVVALGSVLFLLLLGVCWCQCCPHSCCCYVSCWCCPDTCCCPRHLYEAGKGIKTGTTSPQVAAYPPFFVSGVPTMLPIAPPSLVDKMSLIPPSDSSIHPSVHGVGVPYRLPSSQDQDSLRVLQYVEKQLAHFNPARSTSQHSCSLSELSSLHEGDSGFRQTYRNIQKKALPAIPDHDSQPEPQHCRQSRSPEPQRYRDDPPSPQHQRHRDDPPSPQRYRDDPDAEHRRYRDEPLSPRRYSDDPPPSSQTHRSTRSQHQRNCEQEDSHSRWNPRSEHLQRKTFRMAGRTGSLDELEEFAASHRTKGTRGAGVRNEERRGHEMELREYPYPSYRDAPPQQYREEDDDNRDDCNHDNSDCDDHPRRNKKNGRHHISPLSSPKKRRGTWDSERPVPPPPRASSPPSSASQDKDYDGTFLAHLLERKAKLRGAGQGRGGEEKSSGESGRHHRGSPSNRAETGEGHPLPPYSETERSRTDGSSPRQIPTYTRPPQAPAHSLSSRRDEPRDKSRKVSTLLSRDSLIV